MLHTDACNRTVVVYSMTNEAAGNKVNAFRQKANGTLAFMQSYETGGNGTGVPVVDPLASQGSLLLSGDGRFLFAVNAGSDSISSFRVSSFGGLTLADVQLSGGIMPNSLAESHGYLYVANVGNSVNASNISGFHVSPDGKLDSVFGGISYLSAGNAKPASAVFHPDGSKIAVSEENTNHISVLIIQPDGRISSSVVNDSSGAGPFGSVFLANGVLLVAEAGANALSSYHVLPDGALQAVHASAPNSQAGTCWVVTSPDERFAYTSNAGSHTITAFRIGRDGDLLLTDIVYSTPHGNGAPIDSGTSDFTRTLLVLNGNEGSISVFSIDWEGKLRRLQVFADTGLPVLGAQGLAVWDSYKANGSK